MAEIRFNLHPAQTEIHAHPARFKIVAAGRRFGKTVYSVIRCFEEALATENARGVVLDSSSEVIYVATDREQARRNAWPYFKQFAAEIEKATGLECRTLEKTSVVELPPELGGCRIRLLGMDDPDAARGMKLRFAVLDEYADMPPRVWPEIIRPALADCRGGALFIGTPKGRNHFYELVERGVEDHAAAIAEGRIPVWGVFNYSMDDNPLIHEEERAQLAEEYSRGSSDLYEQEIKAKFITAEGQLFRADQFKIIDELPPAHYETFLAVDLAGFAADPDRKREMRKLDDTAIAVVSIDAAGRWFVRDIHYGKWGVRETANRIVRTAKKHEVPLIGIEKGALKNAVEPYMTEYMARYNRWFEVKPLTHGNKAKYDRVQWALQGRAQKGDIYLIKGDWNGKLIDQAVSFPSRYVHDDLIDALSYIDQMAPVNISKFDIAAIEEQTKYTPQDHRAGY
jgi:predicted phage terminase large subunit-like protein